MQTIEIPLVGPTYQSRSAPVGNQHTKNFYIEVDPQANEQAVLMPFPGCKYFTVSGSGAGRGVLEYGGNIYVVSGTELYRITSGGTATLIGTISGSNRVGMADDGTNLVITVGDAKPYTYDGTTLTQGSDADLPNANTVIYINSRVIYDRPLGTAFADLDDPLVVNSANILNANTDSDSNVAVVKRGQQIFAFGNKTIEPINFTSSGTPPYARINSAVQPVGTVSAHSVASNKEYVYFLGSDRNVYRMQGFQSMPISNPAIGSDIEGYSVVSDAYGVCFNFDSQFFYLLTFPTEDVTWLYNQNSGLWTNLGYGVSGAHLIAGYVYAFNKHLVIDRRNGNIYELDFETFTDNSGVIQRQRTTKTIQGKDYGMTGKTLFMSRLELIIEGGVSLVSAQSQVIMQYSDDNGQTWSTERWAYIGQQGDYGYKIEWFGLGGFVKRMFRFTMSDPIKWVLVSCNADVEVGLG
jgi:hypothetical protein